jgi:hypothetical protein
VTWPTNAGRPAAPRPARCRAPGRWERGRHSARAWEAGGRIELDDQWRDPSARPPGPHRSKRAAILEALASESRVPLSRARSSAIAAGQRRPTNGRAPAPRAWARWLSRATRSPQCNVPRKAGREVVTGTIGARRAWTVSMISALSMPCR